jgi:site-specific DNA-methyltransferase (adenine-specific)
LPPLTDAEYEELKESIRRDGVLVPSIVDSDGNIVDGDNRERACTELGIFCPREVREFSSNAEKLQLAIRLNVNRRHLTGKQRRELIALYLKSDAAINDRHLGDVIGVSKNTVADERRKLVATGQIDQLPKRRGRDGKLRPAKHRRIIANTPKEAEKAMEAIRVLPPSCAGKILDVGTATRRARKNTFTDAREQQIIVPTPGDDIRIFHCGFQQLEATASLPASSVRLVATDIPYGKEFVSQIPDLAAFANRVLIEGGIFLTYYGHLYLPDLIAELGRQLNWGWIMCSTWGGGANIVHHPCVWSHWKPIVVYSKGKWSHAERFPDVLRVQGQEKDLHPWQQNLEEVKLLVGYFSKPGDLVCDPCGGSFTTALACKQLGRRFVGCDVSAECISKGQARLAGILVSDEDHANQAEPERHEGSKTK